MSDNDLSTTVTCIITTTTFISVNATSTGIPPGALVNESPTSNPRRPSAGVIAGSTIGSILGLLLCLLLLYCVMHRRAIQGRVFSHFRRSRKASMKAKKKAPDPEVASGGEKDMTDYPSTNDSRSGLMRNWRGGSIDKPLPPQPDPSTPDVPLKDVSSQSQHAMVGSVESDIELRIGPGHSKSSLSRSSHISKSLKSATHSSDEEATFYSMSSKSGSAKPYMPRLRTDSVSTVKHHSPSPEALPPTPQVHSPSPSSPHQTSPSQSSFGSYKLTVATNDSSTDPLPPLEERTNLFSIQLLGEFAPQTAHITSSSTSSTNTLRTDSTPSTPSSGTTTPTVTSSPNPAALSMRSNHSSSNIPFRPTLSPIPSFTSPSLPPFPQESASSYSEYSRSDRFTPVTPIQRSANALEGLRMLDLVFIQDCTASQTPYIESAKESIEKICQNISTTGRLINGGLRFGLVAFRDHPPQERSFVTKYFEFTSDLDQMKANISTLSAKGGGDRPEAVTAAMFAALNMNWRSSATKMVVLITDAPPHGVGEMGDGFNDGSPDQHDPIQVARAMATRGITFFVIACEPTLSNTFHYAHDLYLALTRLSSGLMLPLSNADLLSRIIISSALENLDIERLIRESGRDVEQLLFSSGGVQMNDFAQFLQSRLQNEKVKEVLSTKIYNETEEAKHNVNRFMVALNLREARPYLRKVPVGARFTEEYKTKGAAAADEATEDEVLTESSVSSSQVGRIAMQSAWRTLFGASLT